MKTTTDITNVKQDEQQQEWTEQIKAQQTNKMQKRFKKYVFRTIILVIAFMIVIGFVPIKITITSEDEIKNSCYYIISLIPEGSTDSGNWICYDQNGIRYTNVVFQGKLPQNILSADICESGTTFVIYGSLRKESNSYILQSKSWDILYNVNRNCNSLRLDFDKFITLYDTKYFDFILKN